MAELPEVRRATWSTPLDENLRRSVALPLNKNGEHSIATKKISLSRQGNKFRHMDE